MADFNVDVPQVQGGDMRVTPASNMATANALGNVASTASNVVNDLFTGRAEQRKLTQQKQIGAALGDQEQRLSAIADAVDQGQISSAVGRMRARAITTQAIANNPILTEQLQANHSKFMDTAGLGKSVAEGTVEEKMQQSLIAKAADSGFITPGMSPEQQVQASRDWQRWDSAKRNLSDAQQQLDYQRGLIGLQGDQLGIVQKNQSITKGAIEIQQGQLNLAESQAKFQVASSFKDLAKSGLARTQNQINEVLDGLSKNTNDPQARDLALIKLNNLKAELAKNTAVDVGGFGTQYISDLSAPSKESIDNAINYVNGSITKQQLDNTNSNAVARQTHLLFADQNVARYASLSDHFKNNAQLLAAGDNLMYDYMTRNGLISFDAKPGDPTPSSPDVKKSFGNYLDSTKMLLQNVTAGKTAKDGNEPAEAANNVASLLKAVPAYSASNDNPSNYNQLVDFLASPSFGKYMEINGKVNADAANAAFLVLQREYTEGAIKTAREQMFEAPVNSGTSHANNVISVYAPNMAKGDERLTSERVEAVPAPGGVTFQSKDTKDADAVERARQMNIQVAPIVNRLVRMTAHLQGSTNYQKVYEDRYSKDFTPEPKPEEAPANPKKAPDVTQASGANNYENMSHAELLRLRGSLAPDDPKQVELAAYEHQAFAREWVKENPVLATASLTAAIPAYSAAKAVGAVKSRTPASFNEVAAAYKGIGQGLGIID